MLVLKTDWTEASQIEGRPSSQSLVIARSPHLAAVLCPRLQNQLLWRIATLMPAIHFRRLLLRARNLLTELKSPRWYRANDLEKLTELATSIPINEAHFSAFCSSFLSGLIRVSGYRDAHLLLLEPARRHTGVHIGPSGEFKPFDCPISSADIIEQSEPVCRDDIMDSFGRSNEQARIMKVLDRLQMDWLIPLRIKDTTLGCLLLSEPLAVSPFSRLGISRIRKVADELALTLFLMDGWRTKLAPKGRPSGTSERSSSTPPVAGKQLRYRISLTPAPDSVMLTPELAALLGFQSSIEAIPAHQFLDRLDVDTVCQMTASPSRDESERVVSFVATFSTFSGESVRARHTWRLIRMFRGPAFEIVADVLPDSQTQDITSRFASKWSAGRPKNLRGNDSMLLRSLLTALGHLSEALTSMTELIPAGSRSNIALSEAMNQMRVTQDKTERWMQIIHFLSSDTLDRDEESILIDLTRTTAIRSICSIQEEEPYLGDGPRHQSRRNFL